jgi:hypothetical protein
MLAHIEPPWILHAIWRTESIQRCKFGQSCLDLAPAALALALLGGPSIIGTRSKKQRGLGGYTSLASQPVFDLDSSQRNISDESSKLRLAWRLTTATSSVALTLLSTSMATDLIVRALTSPRDSQSTDSPFPRTPRLSGA